MVSSRVPALKQRVCLQDTQEPRPQVDEDALLANGRGQVEEGCAQLDAQLPAKARRKGEPVKLDAAAEDDEVTIVVGSLGQPLHIGSW